LQNALYLEDHHKGTTITDRFLEASKSAVGNDIRYYETMIGILKALKEYHSYNQTSSEVLQMANIQCIPYSILTIITTP